MYEIFDLSKPNFSLLVEIFDDFILDKVSANEVYALSAAEAILFLLAMCGSQKKVPVSRATPRRLM